MAERLTQKQVNALRAGEKPQYIADGGVPGLSLFIGTTGKKTWYVLPRVNGRRIKHRLGGADVLTVEQARQLARDFMYKLAHGENPHEKPEAPKITKFRDLLDLYEPIVLPEQRSGRKNLKMLRSAFRFLLEKPITSITVLVLESWRSKRHKNGVKKATINRQTASLKAVLSWAAKRGIIDSNPLEKLYPLPMDDSKVIERYLEPDEQERLVETLNQRDDHMKPLVLLALATGARRAALFSLTWKDVDLQGKMLTLQPNSAKSKKLQYVPLSSGITAILAEWRMKNGNPPDNNLVFPSPRTGSKLDNVKKAWASIMRKANISGFRFHDCRHTIASALISGGNDLNVVKALLGHSDTRVTQRYSHLMPDVLRNAVEQINITGMNAAAGNNSI